MDPQTSSITFYCSSFLNRLYTPYLFWANHREIHLIGQAIVSAAKTVVNAVKTVANEVKTTVETTANTVVNNVKPIVETVAKTVDSVVKKAVERAPEVVFDTIGQLNSLPNTMLGVGLGLLSGETPTIKNGGTIVFENVNENSLTGKLMTNVLDNAPAFTLGYTILAKDPKIKQDIFEHELGHVTQSAILGNAYLPMYGICWLAAGGWWDNDSWNHNIMEVGPLHPDWPGR
jgi:hypothetical protein